MKKDKEFIGFANSFQAIARLRLESITELMERLGNPQENLKFVHVAGTNGKGSVCFFLQSILTEAGYKTGRYTSPNMVKVNERISVDNVDISDVELEELLLRVQTQAEKMSDMPTQFEIWTATAFLYFEKQKCDYVVLEVGMGGERDATNVISAPVISVITKIAADHTGYLGNSLEEIASAKAGIIKKNENGVTVTCRQEREVTEVIENRCRECGNRLVVAEEYTLHAFNGDHEIIDAAGVKNIEIGMLGIHQAENASIATECAKILGISEEYIRIGIKKARNIGRLEIVSKNPYILFDGAHNRNGMESLVSAINRYFKDCKKNFIMDFMKDKDIDGAIDILCENIDIRNSTVYTVRVKNNERAMSGEELAEIFNEKGYPAKSCKSIGEAVEQCGKNELIVVCGSLYLYKDLLEEVLGDKVD